MQASGQSEVTGWDEQAYEEPAEGGKLTRAAISQRWTGAFTGSCEAVSLMAYAPDGATARYAGYQRMDGTLDGKRGTFVVEAVGTFDGSVARSTLRIVPGSGTGELAGLTGEGTFEAPVGPTGTYTLDYDLG